MSSASGNSNNNNVVVIANRKRALVDFLRAKQENEIEERYDIVLIKAALEALPVSVRLSLGHGLGLESMTPETSSDDFFMTELAILVHSLIVFSSVITVGRTEASDLFSCHGMDIRDILFGLGAYGVARQCGISLRELQNKKRAFHQAIQTFHKTHDTCNKPPTYNDAVYRDNSLSRNAWPTVGLPSAPSSGGGGTTSLYNPIDPSVYLKIIEDNRSTMETKLTTVSEIVRTVTMPRAVSTPLIDVHSNTSSGSKFKLLKCLLDMRGFLTTYLSVPKSGNNKSNSGPTYRCSFRDQSTHRSDTAIHCILSPNLNTVVPVDARLGAEHVLSSSSSSPCIISEIWKPTMVVTASDATTGKKKQQQQQQKKDGDNNGIKSFFGSSNGGTSAVSSMTPEERAIFSGRASSAAPISEAVLLGIKPPKPTKIKVKSTRKEEDEVLDEEEERELEMYGADNADDDEDVSMDDDDDSDLKDFVVDDGDKKRLKERRRKDKKDKKGGKEKKNKKEKRSVSPVVVKDASKPSAPTTDRRHIAFLEDSSNKARPPMAESKPQPKKVITIDDDGDVDEDKKNGKKKQASSSSKKRKRSSSDEEEEEVQEEPEDKKLERKVKNGWENNGSRYVTEKDFKEYEPSQNTSSSMDDNEEEEEDEESEDYSSSLSLSSDIDEELERRHRYSKRKNNKRAKLNNSRKDDEEEEPEAKYNYIAIGNKHIIMVNDLWLAVVSVITEAISLRSITTDPGNIPETLSARKSYKGRETLRDEWEGLIEEEVPHFVEKYFKISDAAASASSSSSSCPISQDLMQFVVALFGEMESVPKPKDSNAKLWKRIDPTKLYRLEIESPQVGLIVSYLFYCFTKHYNEEERRRMKSPQNVWLRKRTSIDFFSRIIKNDTIRFFIAVMFQQQQQQEAQ